MWRKTGAEVDERVERRETFTHTHQVQSIHLEAKEYLFAVTVLKEVEVPRTVCVEAEWSIILANKLSRRLASAFYNASDVQP